MLLITSFFANFRVFFSSLGFWGTVMCMTVVFPLAYFLPGDDHGSYEDPFSTWNMIKQSTDIQISVGLYFIFFAQVSFKFIISKILLIPYANNINVPPVTMSLQCF